MTDCREILQHGLQELALSFSEDHIIALQSFIKLIAKWNKAYNLTAVRDELAMAQLHILDSLAVLPHIRGRRIADIGTGAGLPGIPLAIMRPEIEFVLLDANSKKTRFVQQAVLELKLNNVRVEHSRVEQFKPDQGFDTVLMRAFANMQDIIELTSHLLAEDGILLAMKGQAADQELEHITQQYNVIPITVPGIDAERCLVRIEREKKHG